MKVRKWVPALLLSALAMDCERQPVDHGGIEIPDTITPDTVVVEEPRPYLILLSLDGFRPDNLSSYSTVHLGLAIQRGTVAESLIPVFPTHTFPNHYTQATGLYPERHGIVANNF
jgi:predicted AlkP superfamily pyrophosphatase or phosphodiesterase